jgi:LysM repeat protein
MRSIRPMLMLAALPTLALGGLLLAPAAPASAFPSVRRIPASTSNYSNRSSRQIRWIVIHTIEGSEDAGISWFRNPAARVSAHYVVSHAGRITQMVDDMDVAWHAGNSTYNEHAIGIENEGYAGQNRWTSAQYSALADLTRGLCDRYGIPKDRAHIIGHKDVPNQSHVDPGPHFDWGRFLALVNGGNAAPIPPAPTNTNMTYVVQPGDTLSDIAASFGTTWTAIAQANGITNPSSIQVGQRLVIPGATVAPPRTTTPASTSGLYAVEVTTNDLNVRNGVWGQVLGQVRTGQRFVVSREQQGWVRIDWHGRDAWLSAQYVRRVAADAVVVTSSALNVRTQPSASSSSMGLIANDQAHVVLGRSGDWLLVQYDERQGWIHSAYVSALSLR